MLNVSVPTLIRFPKGAVNPDIPAFERRDGIDVLYRGESADILLVSIGAFAQVAVEAAAQAYREGVGVTVIDPRWVKPLPKSLVTMAQNFRRYTNNNVGTSAATSFTANSYDTVVGISVANITGSAVNADVYINDGTNDIYLVKSAPIPSGSALQVLDGGAKFVMQSGDALKIVSDTASSLDVWVSVVDDISS